MSGRSLIAGLLAAGLLVAAQPATAHAHAILERTVPDRGATSAEPPDRVAFYFNEPVEASFGGVRIFDAEGSQVETGEIERPQGDSSGVAVTLRGDLPDGGYTATYRVISADSHPVSGGFVFSVGEGGAGTARSVSELLDESDAGPVTSVTFGVVRWAGFAAIGLAVGAFAFLLIVWRPALRRSAGANWIEASEAFGRRFRTLALIASGVGLVAALASIVMQGAVAGGTSFWSAVDPGVISDVLDTRFGTVAALRALAWAMVAAAVLLPALRAAPVLRQARLGAAGTALGGRLPVPALALIAIPLGFLVAAPGLAGHASTQSPDWLLVPSDVIHVLAMSLWLGGLTLFVIAVPLATRRLDPAGRSRLLAALLVRFSPLALASVIALAATGIAQSIVHLSSFADLIETGFGRAILAKGLLLAALVGLGAHNRRRSIPAMRRLADGQEPPGSPGIALRRALRAEVALIAVVLAVTAALVSYAPPSDAAKGPVSGSATLGAARLEYTVDPATAGANELHLYLFDSETGEQFDAAKEVSVDLALPASDIGPLEADVERSGPGHFIVPAAPFGVAGDWQVEVSMRVSKFEQDETELEVPIG